MDSVKTVQGDTWDTVAYRVYGDATKAQLLMETRENIRLLDYERFPSGIAIATPPVPPEEKSGLPIWRR